MTDSSSNAVGGAGRVAPARGLFVAAAILLIIHAIPEVLAILSVFGSFHAPLPYVFAEVGSSPQATGLVGLVSGALRILAALGLLAGREWGWVLGLLMSLITFSMLTLYLPFGAFDALFAGGVLALLVVGRYRGRIGA